MSCAGAQAATVTTTATSEPSTVLRPMPVPSLSRRRPGRAAQVVLVQCPGEDLRVPVRGDEGKRGLRDDAELSPDRPIGVRQVGETGVRCRRRNLASPARCPPATPRTTTCPSSSAAMSTTVGASARQTTHHGAQNHSSTGWSVVVAGSNAAPSTVCVCRTDSAVVPVLSDPAAPAPGASSASGDPGPEQAASTKAPRSATALPVTLPGRRRGVTARSCLRYVGRGP